MDLRQIVRSVRAHWIVALLTFLVVVGLGAAFALTPAKQYEATVVLFAQPPASSPDPGSDVGAIQIEIPQVVVEADSSVIAADAREQVPARFRSVPVTISATGDPSSNSVTINASSKDPAAAQAYANAAAARVLRVTNREASSILVLSQLGSAELPTSPTNPRTTIVVASVVLGLIAAVFAALGATALRRFVLADEVWTRLKLPVLGEVPTFVTPGSSPAEMFAGAGSAVEAFQQLRSRLHIMFQGAHPVIAFTSCDAREGKSSVAAYTAWALATPGHFVVAVDSDLRHPSLHEIFGVDLSPGVSDITVSSGPTELLAETGNRYLNVIPAGLPTRHPADIAAGDVPRLMQALVESDRTVVLDCPPISGIAETTILVAKADAVIVVVDARTVDFEHLEQGLAQMRASGANVVGIVLNRVRRPKPDAGYQFYETTDIQGEGLASKIRGRLSSSPADSVP
jgi:succinoglycan biosynthesis transport protein ExoP